MYQPQDQPLDLFAISLMVLLCAVWGGAFVAIKIGLLDMPPLGSAALRFCLTSLVLLSWAWYQEVPLIYGRAEVWTLAILSFLFFSVNIAVYVGTDLTTSGRATVFFYTQPIFLSILAHYFLTGDRLTVRKGWGLFLAFCGLVFLFVDRLSLGTISSLLGDVLVLGGALSWAVQNVIVKRAAGKLHPVATVVWPTLFSWPLLALLSFWLERGEPFVLSGRAILSLLYLALFSAAFGFVAFAWLLQQKTVTRLSALIFLAPAFGVGFARLLLQETLTGTQLLGVAGVCLGVYIVNSGGAPRAPVPTETLVEADQEARSWGSPTS